MKLIINFILLMSTSAALATGFDLDKFQVGVGTSSEVVEAVDQRARVFGLNINVLAEDKLSDELTLFVDFTASFQRGSNETLGEVAEFAPNDNLNINAGGLKYTPFNFLKLTAGALDQSEYNSPLLVGGTTFAGVQEKITWSFLYLQAQQSIPQNNRLTQRTGTVEDSTPYFGMETLGIKMGNKRTIFKTEASHYLYRDLSANIASASREFGNSTNNESGDAVDFLYEFEGTNVSAHFEHIFLNGLRVLSSGQYLYNDKAPEERNRGQLAKLGLGNKNYLVYGETFENQSDTSPGFYNSKYYGHNNMKGSSAGIAFKDKTYTFEIKYTKTQVIEDLGILQDDMELITLNLVKLYEL